jgi:hypothetical protein
MANHTSDSEKAGAVRWLLFAGGAAILLSVSLFRADEYLVGGPERDRAHNKKLAELRSAQASLPSRVTDNRQTLDLTLQPAPAAADTDHETEGHAHAH